LSSRASEGRRGQYTWDCHASCFRVAPGHRALPLNDLIAHQLQDLLYRIGDVITCKARPKSAWPVLTQPPAQTGVWTWKMPGRGPPAPAAWRPFISTQTAGRSRPCGVISERRHPVELATYRFGWVVDEPGWGGAASPSGRLPFRRLPFPPPSASFFSSCPRPCPFILAHPLWGWVSRFAHLQQQVPLPALISAPHASSTRPSANYTINLLLLP